MGTPANFDSVSLDGILSDWVAALREWFGIFLRRKYWLAIPAILGTLIAGIVAYVMTLAIAAPGLLVRLRDVVRAAIGKRVA